MDKDSELFIERTKALMRKKRIKQKGLAAITGYSDSGVSGMFSRGNAAIGFIKKTAIALGTSTDYLLGLTEEDGYSNKLPVPIIDWEELPNTRSVTPSSLTKKFAMWYTTKGDEKPLPEGCFCIRVKDSFAEPEYYEGDVVLISPQDEVDSQELALVFIPKLDQSVICFVKKGFLNIILQPKNTDFSDDDKPLRFKPDEIQILGQCLNIIKEEI